MAQNPQEPLSSRLSSTLKATAGSLTSSVKPAESELGRWRRTFDKFAKEEVDGQKFLNPSQFIDAIAPTDEGFSKIKREQYANLFRVADSARRGLVSFEDFVVFETLLKRPDADYQLAFQVFDVDASGTIDFDEFKAVLSANTAASGIPFDFDCAWMKLYVGKRGDRHVLGYHEFTQLIKGYQGERLRQAFHFFDADGDGYINPEEFQRIIVEIAGHKLSDSVLGRLPTLCTLNPGRRISYSEVIAFHNIIREMDTVERIIEHAVKKSKDGRIDISDFLDEAAGSMRYGMFTPMEANIIWHFASRGNAGTGQRLALADFQALLDAKWQPPETASIKQPSTVSGGFLAEAAQSTYNFVQGGIAGGLGAYAVYPIDLVKTRLQNQRSTVVGEVLYRNAFDCVKKVYTNEGGIRAFYRGVLPQLVGVAPEKAIKLTVNELVRKKATDPETGRIPLLMEIVAGGSAGGCQVVVTNPLEIIKIRLQMAGEITRAEGGTAAPRGAFHVIKQLGLIGLYKGATACFARDIPFSMIYFTSYAHLKKDVFHEGHHGKVLSFGELLAAAGIAGMPAAYLTTPADVVKTRLQSQARAGQTVYKGIIDGLSKIFREEGLRTLFKGGLARVIRSSPQFAVTLACYELLHKHFPYPYAPTPVVHRPVLQVHQEISRIRARNALRILLDCSSRFGMVDSSTASKRMQLIPKSFR
ncbi:mitochondrial inner membrane protein, putative [Cryptococcus deneoformans JEC21]|uniref:Mitochondrial inner membrane protein, putative n=1 Tax=Cryptococcus deneoformans (strain JEC21 / ATCC MYA-565) TaxID=214684 RepID=Q5KKK6_CRYD1|nr:mitochondrial inner membrane protein, putative [Cryptococcus neoformans var. neoformans JEC21]AAW42258.1 mitochondrial inner membrane protein, putative [Cryptococcus neoformans var. neoformans JEC21]